MKKTPLATVLQVEDSAFDRLILARSFKKYNLRNKLITAENGVEALQILRSGVNELEGQVSPYLVFFDLNMPRMKGKEFLDAIRGDAQLRGVVAYAMSTSCRPAEIEACYKRGISGFILKEEAGSEFERICELIKLLNEMNTFPGQESIYF